MISPPFTRDLVGARPGGVWEYVSASRLGTWLACPLRFKLRYLDGIPSVSSPAMLVGKAVHAGLECFYRHRQLRIVLSCDEVVRHMDDDWEELSAGECQELTTPALDLELRSQAQGLVRAYLAHLPASEPAPTAVEVAAEAPLIDPMTGEDLGIPLVGILDLVLPNASGPIIADFKSTSRSSDPLEIAHEIQLSCYAYLLRSTSADQESGLEIRNLVKTKVPKVQFQRYAARSEQHFARLFSVIRAYLDDLEAKRFVFRPGLGCAMCDMRNTCCQA